MTLRIETIVRTTWVGLLCGLALLVALGAAAPPSVLGGERAQAAPDEATPPPAPSPERAPRAPRAPRTPRVPEEAWTTAPEALTPPEPPTPSFRAFEPPVASIRVVPRGWFGFGFQCNECTANRSSDDSAAVWRFGNWPKVYSVDLGSPAARAGIRRGDVITAIDGVSLLSSDGGRRFGAIQPGQSVRWTLVRDGAPQVVVAQAIERPGRRETITLAELYSRLGRMNELSDPDEMRRQLTNLRRQIERLKVGSRVRVRPDAPTWQRSTPGDAPDRRLRYAGVIGGSEVEVRGTGSVIVSESDLKDQLVINTGDAVVVIRLAKGATKKAAEERDRDR